MFLRTKKICFGASKNRRFWQTVVFAAGCLKYKYEIPL